MCEFRDRVLSVIVCIKLQFSGVIAFTKIKRRRSTGQQSGTKSGHGPTIKPHPFGLYRVDFVRAFEKTYRTVVFGILEIENERSSFRGRTPPRFRLAPPRCPAPPRRSGPQHTAPLRPAVGISGFGIRQVRALHGVIFAWADQKNNILPGHSCMKRVYKYRKAFFTGQQLGTNSGRGPGGTPSRWYTGYRIPALGLQCVFYACFRKNTEDEYCRSSREQNGQLSPARPDPPPSRLAPPGPALPPGRAPPRTAPPVVFWIRQV